MSDDAPPRKRRRLWKWVRRGGLVVLLLVTLLLADGVVLHPAGPAQGGARNRPRLRHRGRHPSRVRQARRRLAADRSRPDAPRPRRTRRRRPLRAAVPRRLDRRQLRLVPPASARPGARRGNHRRVDRFRHRRHRRGAVQLRAAQAFGGGGRWAVRPAPRAAAGLPPRWQPPVRPAGGRRAARRGQPRADRATRRRHATPAPLPRRAPRNPAAGRPPFPRRRPREGKLPGAGLPGAGGRMRRGGSTWRRWRRS